MKNILIKLTAAAFLLTILSACNDPIFQDISEQQKIEKPFIPGSPTNFVIYKGIDSENNLINNKENLYVASGGNIYKYDENWHRINIRPGGDIFQLAANSGYLYALCLGANSRGVIKRNTNPAFDQWESGWDEILNRNIQSIYAVNESDLFICAQNLNGTFQIFYSNGGESFVPVPGAEETAFLRGVIFTGTEYILCAGNLYSYSGVPEEEAVKITEVSNFRGIINLGNNFAGITRDGRLYNINSEGIIGELVSGLGGRYRATGAIALWQSDAGSLLLVGRQDITYSTESGYTYGYMEIDVIDGVITGSFREPGDETITTVSNKSSYRNSIGRNPVSYLIQWSANAESEKILYASTQRNGVWRLKEDWNAQTRSN